MMWWLPLATAVLIGLVLIMTHTWSERRLRAQTATYRLGYVQLVSKMAGVTDKVNRMEPMAHKIRDKQLLDYYESCLKMLENLLATLRGIPNFGDEPDLLRSAFILVDQCDERVNRTFDGFVAALKGKKPDYAKMYDWRGEVAVPVKGCYFCSRPYLAESFRVVSAKINGDTLRVQSCRICREELESTKKVKVLYFMKDGNPVHWSQVSEYTPSEHYWDLNKRKTIYKKPQLELISTEPSPDQRC